MILKYIRLSLLLLLSFDSYAQLSRLNSFEKIKKEWSPINEIKFRNIGPTIMSGRVTDIEVNPDNTNEFYVAYASGGLWHTTNNGHSMTPIFDNEASITIGDIAVNWREKMIWVGTGEANSSRSSYAGVGVYTSADNGKTWIHKGLEESHHISRIVLHPQNAQVAWIAVIGHLYSPNSERGIYKTTDGGYSWKKTIYINDTTGFIDLQIDPDNADILYASSWSRTRKAWQFNGAGEESGIYKSINGGDNWQLLSTEQSGFPTGKHVGRIGIALSKQNSKTIYALVDNQANQPEKKDIKSSEKKLTARELLTMSRNDFINLDQKMLTDYLKQNEYPAKYTAESLKKSVTENEFTVKEIAEWKLSDADANLFDTPIYGAELYRSDDAGISWRKTHEGALSGMYFTYGYYFGTVQVSPVNVDKVLIAGYPILKSEDGGKNFKQIDGDNCHPDYHSIWINSKNDQHIITGNDGGVNITYDNGNNWYKANNPAVGQFYAIQVDDAEPYNVYGGLQDNGTWVGPSNHSENTSWHQNGTYAYKNIGGGDGMQVQVDTRNNSTYFAGYQFGNYYCANINNDENVDVKPVHDIGQKPFRFNWQSPILLSRHNQDVFYIGSNCLHRSLQQGKNLETLSGDLTKANQKGNVPYNTLTCINESPLRFGLLYTGSDDGTIQVSKDGGYTWKTVMNDPEAGMWVTRIIASKYKTGRVYASLNLYRADIFDPLIYVSEDFGENWQIIGKNLPEEPVNVIREDVKDENILYAGTDNGLYVSFNRGQTFVRWDGGLPRVAIHDIAIQERANEIVLGTHGRSIYIAKLDLVQAYNKIKDQNWVLFDIEKIKYNKNLGNKTFSYSEPQSRKVSINFYTSVAGQYDIQIASDKGEVYYTTSKNISKGIHVFEYDLSVNKQTASINSQLLQARDDGKYYLPPGIYTVTVATAEGTKSTTALEIFEKKEP